MRKRDAIFIVIAAVVFVGSCMPSVSEAAGIACVGHGGVNCIAGPSIFGYAQCYDNTTSSMLYSRTGECATDEASGCTSPRPVGCINSSQLQELQNQYGRYIYDCQLKNYQDNTNYPNCFFPSMQRQIQICSQQIDQYDIEQRVYNSCITDYYRAILANASNTLDIQIMQQELACYASFGYTWDVVNKKCIGTDLLCQSSIGAHSRVFNGASGKPVCVCDDGFVKNANNTACVAASSVPVTAQPASSSAPAAKLVVNLGTGATGSQVVVLQKFLEAKGLLVLPVGTKEGYFGAVTKKALIDFQRSAGITATGYCGAITRAAMNAAL